MNYLQSIILLLQLALALLSNPKLTPAQVVFVNHAAVVAQQALAQQEAPILTGNQELGTGSPDIQTVQSPISSSSENIGYSNPQYVPPAMTNIASAPLPVQPIDCSTHYPSTWDPQWPQDSVSCKGYNWCDNNPTSSLCMVCESRGGCPSDIYPGWSSCKEALYSEGGSAGSCS